VESGCIQDPKAIGLALGSVAEEWQQYVFRTLAATPSASALRAFSYAVWREPHFVDRYALSELMATVDSLLEVLATTRSARGVAEWLELLLGLLRTRSSANPEIRTLLQPHQKITKELAKQVERVTEVISQSHATLFSRVQLNVQKPVGDRTPDLLYALRLYLTGDDGAHAIHVASVSDGDNE
jgi:hypothetical protein